MDTSDIITTIIVSAKIVDIESEEKTMLNIRLSNRYLVCILACLFLVLVIYARVGASEINHVVQLSNGFYTDPTIGLNVITDSSLQAASFEITYDSTVVRPLSCSPTDNDVLCNLDFSDDIIRANVVSESGISSTELLQISFECLDETNEENSPLELTIDQFVDSSGNTIEAQVQSSTFYCTDTVPLSINSTSINALTYHQWGVPLIVVALLTIAGTIAIWRKRTLSGLVLVILMGVCLLTLSSGGLVSAESDNYPPALGDANCDISINVIDSLFIRQFNTNTRTGSSTDCPLSTAQIHQNACDVTIDGSCTRNDADLIQQCDVGFENQFCQPDNIPDQYVIHLDPSLSSTATDTIINTAESEGDVLMAGTDNFTAYLPPNALAQLVTTDGVIQIESAQHNDANIPDSQFSAESETINDTTINWNAMDSIGCFKQDGDKCVAFIKYASATERAMLGIQNDPDPRIFHIIVDDVEIIIPIEAFEHIWQQNAMSRDGQGKPSSLSLLTYNIHMLTFNPEAATTWEIVGGGILGAAGGCARGFRWGGLFGCVIGGVVGGAAGVATTVRDKTLAYNLSRVDDIRNAIREFDVVVLQEAFDEPVVKQMLSIGFAIEFDFTRVVGPNKFSNGGVIILTKGTIERQFQRTYGESCYGAIDYNPYLDGDGVGEYGDADCLADKGVMYARINLNNQLLHVFGTHFDAGGGSDDVAAREGQFNIIRDLIDSMDIPSDQPVIITGDLNVNFNVKPDDDKYDETRTELNNMFSILDATPTWEFSGQDAGASKVDEDGNPAALLDYVLVSNGHLQPTTVHHEVLDFEDANGNDLSDHLPVLAEFTFDMSNAPTTFPYAEFFSRRNAGGDFICNISLEQSKIQLFQTDIDSGPLSPQDHECENDEAESLILFDTPAGTTIRLFVETDGDRDDNWVEIETKQFIERRVIGDFEESFEDDEIKMTYDRGSRGFFGGYGSLNDEVSRIQVLSPQINFTDCLSIIEIPTIECEALVDFYNSTSGTNWNDNTGWLQTNFPCSSWYGISCSNGHVTGISLGGQSTDETFGLVGSIPNSIGDLSKLTNLSIHYNELSGSIPPALTDLIDLNTINIGGNLLTGPIPSQIGNLTNLVDFYAGGNSLSGVIPSGIEAMTSLLGFQVSGNDLSGNLPSGMGSLTQLKYINLNGNDLTGEIPIEWESLINLERLDLAANRDLTGSIPLGFADFGNMSWFTFDHTNLCEPANANFQNWLNGIPDLWRTDLVCGPVDCDFVRLIPIAECEALVDLYNSTDGPNWSDGTDAIQSSWLQTNNPCIWLGITCTDGHVTRIYLMQNQSNNHAGVGLNGQLPSLVDLTHLTGFHVANNQLSGTVAQLIPLLPTSIESLTLSGNDYPGGLPTTIKDLPNLRFLYISGQDWEGTEIPSEIGYLTNLEHFQMSGNGFSGSIPPEMGSLTKLTYINLNSSNLTDGLSVLGSLVNLEVLGIGGNDFTGPIPSGFMYLSNMNSFDFQWMDLCEPTDADFQNWLMTIDDLKSTNVMCP